MSIKEKRLCFCRPTSGDNMNDKLEHINQLLGLARKATDHAQSYVAQAFPDLPRETVRFEVSSIGCAVALEKNGEQYYETYINVEHRKDHTQICYYHCVFDLEGEFLYEE